MNRYLDLKRSQIVIAIYTCDRDLLSTGPSGKSRIKAGSQRHSEIQRRRAELLDALQIKDRELIDRFEKSGYP